MKQYPKYKKSGILSIEVIPSHWETLKLRLICDQIFTGNTPVYAPSSNEFLVFGQRNNQKNGIDFTGIKYADPDFYASRTEDEFLRYGDVLLNTLGGGSVGRIGYYDIKDQRVITDGHVMVLRSNKSCTQKYLYYFLYSQQSLLEEAAVGSTNQAFLTTTQLYQWKVVVPPLAEQETIVHYLDEKTAKIDESVYLLEQQKADLQEFRKALISQTVTRGLNPNAKLKDSGIQWMGGVPAEWRIAPLKTLLSLLTDGTHQTPTYLDKGIPFVSIKDMSSGKLNFSDAKYISQEEHELLSKHAPVAKGDILFSRIGTLGVFIKVDTDEVFDIFVSLGLMKIIPDAINTDFLVYYLSSDTIRKYIDIVKAGEGTSAAKFNLTDVSKTPILLPSQAEQQAIVEYLDSKTAKIDETIAWIDTQIADLKAYRIALITEAVTGKMDVRLEN